MIETIALAIFLTCAGGYMIALGVAKLCGPLPVGTWWYYARKWWRNR